MNLSLIRTAMLALSLGVLSTAAIAKDQLRPPVGQPLQEAQTLQKSKDYKGALAKIAEAEGQDGLTPYEQFVIAQMKGATLAGSGDAVGAAAQFEKVLAMNRLSPNEALGVTEAIAGTYVRAKNYPKALEWIEKYRAAGGTKSDMLSLVPQIHYLSGDYQKAAQETAAVIAAQEKAGVKPGEQQIQMLASSLQKSGDMVGYTQSLEKMVKYYPTPAYWSDVIQRTARKPGFNRGLELDMYRLLHVTGNLNEAKDVMEAAQIAVQGSLHGEAKGLVEEAYSKKIFGVGQQGDVERQNRLKTLVLTRYDADLKSIAAADKDVVAAPTGDPLVKQGMAYVTYGQAPKGLPMIEEGIKKGSKNAEQAKLQLGYAYYLAGDKAKAIQAFKQVGGTDGSADFARLWIIVASRGA